MIINVFGIIMLVPLIFALIWKFINSKTLWQSIKDEYYLFIGYSLTFFTVYLLLGFFYAKTASGSIVLSAYVILYVVVDIIRNTLITGSSTIIDDKLKDIKLLGK